MFGRQPYGVDARPVAGLAGPAFGMRRARGAKHLIPLREDGDVAMRVSIVWRHEMNGTVLVYVIVPLYEGGDPLRRIGDRGKRLRGKARAILQRAKQRFGVGIVVTHARPTEGRNHPQAFERADHRRALHWAAVVRVQHEPLGIERAVVTDLREQCGRVGLGLCGMHGPAHDAAAPDIHHEIQVSERAAHGTRKIRDIPAPHLIRRGGDVRRSWARHGRGGAAAMREQLRLAQHAIHGRCGREVLSGIREAWHDLMRRQVAIRRAVHRFEQHGAFGRRQGVRGRLRRAFPRIVRVRPPPPL